MNGLRYTLLSAEGALQFGHFEDDFQALARMVPTGRQDLSPGAPYAFCAM
ncbi:MAG TPA: hypothetical protein VE154_03925 [Chthoniobacterales bacterium]|nr:hypothetical protein [Chthoniobacterales bacterium]